MKLGNAAAASAALGMALAGGSALANGDAEQCFDKGTLTYFDCPVAEEADGSWMVRVRALGVIPDEGENFDGTLAGTELEIDDSIVPELDITYFFSDNWAAELVLGTTPHEVSTTTGTDLGSVWLLPPTVTLQYHFTEFGAIKPYVGAGVNYTIFYGEDKGALDVSYDDTFGLALQAGVDVAVGDGWYLNADVKKLFLETDIEVRNATTGALIDTGEAEINPWLIGAGIGYRF